VAHIVNSPKNQFFQGAVWLGTVKLISDANLSFQIQIATEFQKMEFSTD